MVFSVGSAPRLYNEHPRLAEIESRESLEIAVEDGNELVELQECNSYSETGIRIRAFTF
jgi:hypothetical protein